MSDIQTPEDTNQGAENIDNDNATLATQNVDEPGDKGPQPIYKDDEPSEKADDQEPGDKEPADKGEEPEAEPASDDKNYDSLDAPEDSLLTDADMERILSQSKEEGLGKEAAQKQVSFANEILKANQDRVNQAHTDLSNRWVEEVKADKELGGEKFSESIALASKAIKEFGTEEFIESLNETKFGNNPEVIRIFARIGKAMSPDKLIVSDAHMKPEKSFEDVFYPNQN